MERNWAVGSTLEARWDIHKALPGRTGTVFVVHDAARQQIHAAKTFPAALFARNPHAKARLLAEADSWIKLNAHPHIVQAHFVQEIDGQPVLFMEYAAGGHLGDWIGTPRLVGNLPAVLRLALELCDGMIHARANGVPVHRNLRPSNCLFTASGALKLTDLGLTPFRAPGIDDSLAAHMAPELFEDAPPVDVAADVYAFGVLLFQMWTGRLPFEGRAWDEFLRLHRDQPAPLEALPAEMQPLVARCLAKVAEYRWRDFEEVREQLGVIHQALLGQPAHARSAAPATAATDDDWLLNIAHAPAAPGDSQLLNTGAALAAVGLHTQAIDTYDRALAVQPANAQTWAFRGNAFLETGDLKEATACYGKAVEADPNLDQVWCNQATIFHRIQLHPESLQCLDRALELNPASARTWAIRAGILDQLGRAGEAAECYRRGRELHPRLADQWAGDARLLRKAGRVEDALALLEQALKLNPASEEAWLAKAICLADLGRPDDSRAAYEALLRINPGHPDAVRVLAPPPAPEVSASQWHNKGAERFQQDDFAEAMRDLAPAPQPELSASQRHNKGAELSRHADLAEVLQVPAPPPKPELSASQWHNKGAELSQQGEFTEALQCFEHAVEQDPAAALSWVHRGLMLRKLGRKEEALASCDRALDNNPDLALAWFTKGMLLGFEMQRYAEALVSLEKAKALGQNAQAAIDICRARLAEETPVETAATLREQGRQLQAQGRPAEALICFEKALAMGPKTAEDLCGKSLALTALGRHQDALRAYDEAMKLAPDFAAGYYRDEARQQGGAGAADPPSAIRQMATLPPPSEPEPDADGWHKLGHELMEKGGNPAEALRFFDRALALDPAHAGAWSGKAVCLNTLGRVAESMQAYHETIRLRPAASGPLMSLGAILYSASRFEEALACYEKARQLGDMEAWQGAYRCRQALGQLPAAN